MKEDILKRPEVLRVRDLSLMFEEGEDVLSAIRSGEVDALMVQSNEGDRVFTLQGADRTHRTVVERMGDGALLLSPDGIIAFCNPAFTKMAGLDGNTVVANHFQALVAPEDVEALGAVLAKSPTEAAACEVALLTDRGLRVPVRVTVSPLDGGSLCAIVTDLTPQRQVEADLEQRVHERTAELEAANVLLERQIEERTRIEAELRASEERFRATFNWAAVGIAHVGADGRFLQVNDRFCDILGYPRETVEGLTFTSITHRDDLEADVRFATRLATGEIPRYHIEKRYIQRGGDVVWVNQTASAVRGDDGDVLYLVIVVEDITAKKLTEEERELLLARTEEARAQAEQAQIHAEEQNALTEMARQEAEQARARAELARVAAETSEAVYRGIGESIPFGIWVCDAHGGVEYLSESFLELTGLSMDECRGMGWTDSLHPEEVAPMMTAWEKCLRSVQPWRWEHRVRAADGTYRTILSRGTAIRDANDRIVRWAGINLDITAEKRVEEALRESEERFRTMADNIAQFAWMSDESGALFWYNQRWYDYTGTTLDEMRGRGWQKVHHPDHVETVTEKYYSHIERGEIWEDTFPLRGKDGQYRWFLSRAIPIRDGQGRVVRWFGTNTDVTELRQLELELRSLNDNLEQRVAERTAELQQAERLALLGQMMAVISHESRNALQRSQVALQMLTRRFRDVPEAQRLVEEALQAQHDLQRVHDEVRDYASPLVVEAAPCPLDQTWQEAWKNLAALRKGRKAALAERIETANLTCEGDRLRLQQVFRNIFENAIAACADPAEVEILCADADIQGKAALRISIRDNGPGLSLEQESRIFEPFYTTKAKGTGLGMTIVRRIIESHGGQISLGQAESGLELVILLPRQVLQ